MSQVKPLQSIALPSTTRADVRAQLLSSIQKISGVITEHNSAAEAQRTLAPAVVAAMNEAGLFAMKSPREVGGAEIHPIDQMAVVEAVVKLDSAAAWTMFIGATVTGRALSAISDKAVDELMTLPDFPIMAGSLKPSGSAIEVEGGFRVSGQWAWGSGVEHADYVIVPVLSSDQTGLILSLIHI